MGAKKEAEREYAQILYCEKGLNKKETAKRASVTEKTIANWVEQYGWDKLRRSHLTTKKHQITQLYDQLEWINNHIATRDIIYDIPAKLSTPKIVKDKNGNETLELPDYNPEDFQIKQGNVATSKEADTIMKLTASINKMENETSIGQIVEVAQEFIDFSREIDLSTSKTITELFDLFINHKVSTNG